MIEDIKDLGLEDLDSEDKFLASVNDKLGLTVDDLLLPIFHYVHSNVNELVMDISNIAPHGDYGLLLEEDDEMAKFLGSVCEPEHWSLHSIISDSKVEDKPMVQFTFYCNAVDDGKSFKGCVYTSYKGKVLHAFARGEE